MTTVFSSFAQMAVRFMEMEGGLAMYLQDGLNKALGKIEHSAKDMLGHYQGSVGPFPAWAPLAESTMEEREHLGFPPDDPLYRLGELRDAIEREVDGLEGVVGVKGGRLHSPYIDNDGVVHGGDTEIGDIALDQELGTLRIPPRPFLGPAAFLNKDAIQALVGAALISGFVTQRTGASFIQSVMPGWMGYEGETPDYR